MPCGKRPLVKSWDKPRHLQVITPSRYEKNEASVKVHWKNVLKSLEESHKDDQFWQSQSNTVLEILGPTLFKRIAKIFCLKQAQEYIPHSEETSVVVSEKFYSSKPILRLTSLPLFSTSDFDLVSDVGPYTETSSESTNTSSEFKKVSRSRLTVTSKLFSKTTSKTFSRVSMKTTSFTTKSKGKISDISSFDESATSLDDLSVHPISQIAVRKRSERYSRNPHFSMLYCNQSETDMIKWKSKYKQKSFEVSASDEFNKKAEILVKKISKEFYDWWVGLGNVEFTSEIKRPKDVESLFQVWFDEHASRSLVLDSVILPCVLESIAKFVGVPKEACVKALKRQIHSDIHAETNPAHTKAFGTCLPQRMKHIPPRNNTEKIWYCVNIPEDLRSMACVWDDIKHLTSTKSFHEWLKLHPQLLMPPYLKALEESGDEKQLFVVPSDYVLTEKSTSSFTQDLTLPVSEFTMELKEVLSKLLNE